MSHHPDCNPLCDPAGESHWLLPDLDAPDAGSAPTTGHDLDVAAVRAREFLARPSSVTGDEHRAKRVAASQRDVPALLAEVDRLTRERDDARRLAWDEGYRECGSDEGASWMAGARIRTPNPYRAALAGDEGP